MPGDIAEKLREEIVESEKIRFDLLKWKIILVAALGAAAFGIGATGNHLWLLALVPVVCLYVDVICNHNNRRILIIANFMRKELAADHLAKRYEDYCSKNREAFGLEQLAIVWTSAVLSAGVFGIAFLAEPGTAILLLIAGGFGVLGSVWLYQQRDYKGQDM